MVRMRSRVQSSETALFLQDNLIFNKIFMPSKEREFRVKLECNECKKINYFTRKNKKNIKDRLEISKFCSHCRKHTTHKETK